MNLLRGIDIPPAIVGMARGLLEAVTLGALAAATVFLADGENVPDNIEFMVPGIVFVVRALEGFADQIDPAKQRGG